MKRPLINGKLYDVVKKAEASIRNTASGDLLETADATRNYV